MRLPLELVSEILDNFCVRGVKELMTVSRPFYGACARRLYSVILLEDLEAAQKCFDTLAFNSTLASIVKKLIIRSKQPINEATLSRFTRTLRSALRSVAPGLIALELNIEKFDPSPHMKRMHCPWLKILSLSCPVGPDIMSFILAHPRLECLAILGSLSLPEQGRRNQLCHRRMRVSMRVLRRLTAPFDAMPIFLPGSRPTSVEVVFSSRSPISEDAEQEFVNFLSGVTALGLVGFGDFRYSLFRVVGDKLKGLVKLKLSLQTAAQGNIVVDGLNVVLPSMPNLYHLHFYPRKVELDLDSFTLDGLTLDFCMLNTWSSLQQSLCVCEMPSRLVWARLKTSGHWLPVIPTEITLKWWLIKTSLLIPTQENIVSTILKAGIIDLETQQAAEEEETTDPYAKCAPISRKIALAVGYVINHAFDVPALLSDEDDSPEFDTAPSSDIFLEQLLLPVRGSDGKKIEPYSPTPCMRPPLQTRSVEERWDLFLTMLGLAALHPVKETMLDLGSAPHFPSVSLIPALNEEQREIFAILLDVVYNSSDGVGGVMLANYMRNPQDCWGEDRIVAVFEQGGFISPTGLLPSLLDHGDL